jgi:hypothetical protein
MVVEENLEKFCLFCLTREEKLLKKKKKMKMKKKQIEEDKALGLADHVEESKVICFYNSPFYLKKYF